MGGILTQHERWDVAVYKLSLKGEEISWIARIVSVADYYDVISTDIV